MKKRFTVVSALLIFMFLASPATADQAEYDTSVLDCLSEEMAGHLIHSDDSTLVRYAKDLGYLRITRQCAKLMRRIPEISPDREPEKLIASLHYLKRLALMYQIAGSDGHLMRDCRYLERQPLSRFHEIMVLRRELTVVSRNTELTTEAKIELVQSQMEQFKSFGDEKGLVKAKYILAELYGAAGYKKIRFQLTRESVAGFESIDYPTLACQALGVLGVFYKKEGNIDSMIVCFERAKELAFQHRLPVHSARILSFYASHYIHTGRFAIAHDLINEAIDLCREFKGGFNEIRFILTAMRFYADLECWGVVESLYNRAIVLLELYKDADVDPAERDLYMNRTDCMLGRILMSRGETSEAMRVFKEARDAAAALPWTEEIAEFSLFWSKGLIENNEYDAALDIIHDGLRYIDEQLLDNYTNSFRILLAVTEYRRGELEKSLRALQLYNDRYQRSIYGWKERIEWVYYYAILGNIHFQRGEEDQALHALEDGLDYLVREASAMDASVHAYLWLNKCDPLRTLMHDLVSSDPTLGYGAELYWRDLYRMLGSAKRADGQTAESVSFDPQPQLVNAQAEIPIIEMFRDRYLTAQQCLTGRDAVHCLYLVHDDEIWRWTVSDTGIRRNILDCPAQKGSRLVLEARKRLADTDNRSDNTIEPDLADNLGLLARTLLPHEIINDDTARHFRLFLVTADGFLGSIPFEALDVGPEGTYTPLLSRTDIAYARYIVCRSAEDNTAPGLILANTHASKEFRNRYLFQPSLSEVSIEAETAAALDREALLLSGPAATKRRLMDIWEDAQYIYFASHIISDPEIPYLVHVPMAEDTTRIGVETTYLDVTDIRSADLGRCGLVVLSGCSSGVPYVEARTEGPSLGDAFLDAGAGAVIQTFWDVRDDTARDLMTSFVRQSNGTRLSKIRSLCETKRRAMLDPDGFRHPAVWASFAIELGRLPAD